MDLRLGKAPNLYAKVGESAHPGFTSNQVSGHLGKKTLDDTVGLNFLKFFFS